jgi:hypothetical protein
VHISVIIFGFGLLRRFLRRKVKKLNVCFFQSPLGRGVDEPRQEHQGRTFMYYPFLDTGGFHRESPYAVFLPFADSSKS